MSCKNQQDSLADNVHAQITNALVPIRDELIRELENRIKKQMVTVEKVNATNQDNAIRLTRVKSLLQDVLINN